MTELQYEPRTDARPVVVERDGDVTRIVIPMQGSYVPVPSWVGDIDLLAFFVGPIWWVTTWLIRTCLRVPKPPRAVFEVGADRFKLSIRDPGSGEITAFDWPRTAVAEARANRYEKGLWLNVTGYVKDTYLGDLPRESIERIEDALQVALAGASG